MIRRQLVIPVTPERLWEVLTDPAQLDDWFGGHFEWELREGAPIFFVGDDGGLREGRVEVVRPQRHLRFRWWLAPPRDTPDNTLRPPAGGGAAGGGARGEAERSETEVSYVLIPESAGTRLTIQERPVSSTDTSAVAGSSPAHGGSTISGNPKARMSPTDRWTAWDELLVGASWHGTMSMTASRARS